MGIAMTLKQLEVFVNVSETKSFSRGAEKSCITQSTASQHIKGLEDELGIRLFDRGREGALLTEAGKVFFSRACRILGECDESRSAIRRFLGMEDVVLKIGASNTPATCLIPRVLGDFTSRFRGVRMNVSQGDSVSVIGELLDEEVELGFIGARYDDDRIHYDHLLNDEIVCAVSPELAGDRQSLSQAELCKVPLVIRGQGSGTQKAVFDALAGTWINRDALKIIAVMGSGEAIIRALLNRSGYGFVSRMSIADELAQGGLTTVRIPGVTVSRTLYAVRREGRELSPAAAAFYSLMLETWGHHGNKKPG